MHIKQILDEIDRWENSGRGNAVMVFLAQIIDRSNSECNLNGCTNPNVVALNDEIARIVVSRADRSDAIFLVDQYSALNYPKDMAPRGKDGQQLVHPTQNGYEKMAQRWLQAILNSDMLPKCP